MTDRQGDQHGSDYQDIILPCVECNQDFVFTADEQRFFYSKGLATPRRCKPCRKARKDSIAKDGGYYGK